MELHCLCFRPARKGCMCCFSYVGHLPLCRQVSEGCARYTVELSRPLGLVLEEKGNGEIVVGEVPKGGQAARQGMVQAGDLLISVTGIAYTRESNYQGATVRSGETLVTLNVQNEVCKAFDACPVVSRFKPTIIDCVTLYMQAAFVWY